MQRRSHAVNHIMKHIKSTAAEALFSHGLVNFRQHNYVVWVGRSSGFGLEKNKQSNKMLNEN